MVTTASKLLFPAAFVALVASWIYGLGTDGQILGVLFLGLKGSVGEVAGYTILQFLAGVLLALGVAASVLRDADPEAQAAAARLETLPPAVAPTGVTYWPVLGALGMTVAAVGLVASPVLFVIGLIGVGLVLLEWMVSAWSERATGDPSVNRQIRNRLMFPIEIPVLGALAVLTLVVSISRVFLAVSRTGSSVVAIVVACLVLALGFVVAYRPRLGKDAIAAMLVVVAGLVIAGGVIGAASGSREFEHHEAEHGTDEEQIGPNEEDSPTDAPGGGDPGAEEDPPQNDPGNTGADDEGGDSPTTTEEPVAEGVDSEDLDPNADESEG